MSWQHDEPGTPESLWLAAAPWQSATELTTSNPGHVVVIAAHPDDETLGAGGLIALAERDGWSIDVVIATDGEASHPASPTHTPHDLAIRRAEEVRTAVSRLAPTARLHQLRLPDGALAHHRPALQAAVQPLLEDDQSFTWLAAPWRGDQHPDHAAAGQVAAALSVTTAGRVQLLEYPIWAWHWAHPHVDQLPWDRAQVLRLPPNVMTAKAQAMAEHHSQVQPLSAQEGDQTLLPDAVLAHFRRDVEVFWASEPTSEPNSLPAAYFDDLYHRDDDPWQFSNRWYERRKRALTLAVLPRERFHRALEPGCSIGLLTYDLAQRCDEVLASDVSARAVALARERTADLPGVQVQQFSVPGQWPQGQFDLVVLSEVGYYCAGEDLSTLAEVATRCLTQDGVLVACHWRHLVPDYPVDGDAVHAVLRAQPGLTTLAHHQEEDFVLDVFVRPPAISVAAHEGLLP